MIKADKIKVDPGLCLTPCEGMFADVKNTNQGSNTDFSSNKAAGLFMKRYQKFKMFYETKEGICLNIFNFFCDLFQI